MRIAGTGIDIVEVSRIISAVSRHGDRFLKRVFTPVEERYCSSRGVPGQHFAARFAVKEAVLKALQTGWSGGIRLRDVEVRNGPAGQPDVRLTGVAARRADEMGIIKIHVSISHTGDLAVANAIAEANDK